MSISSVHVKTLSIVDRQVMFVEGGNVLHHVKREEKLSRGNISQEPPGDSMKLRLLRLFCIRVLWTQNRILAYSTV